MDTRKNIYGRGFFLTSLTFTLSLFLTTSFISAKEQQSRNLPKLIIFYSPTCHKCKEVKETIIPKIEKEFKDKILLEYRDISNLKDYKFLLGLQEKYKVDLEMVLPLFFIEGKFLNSKQEIENNLKKIILDSLVFFPQEEVTPQIDLAERFKKFKPLAIISAGLTDGVNPCAFTVIVFFISFLALQGYPKLELIIIGLSFIFAVFLTYLLLGLGIFNFLYTLKGFWIFAQIFNISIGIFSIFLGVLALADFFKFRKTKKTEGLFLQLPAAIKDRIHSVIGLFYRRPKTQIAEAGKPHILRLLLSAFLSGFLVSLLEAVCTGQLYLPTITFVLKTTPFKLEALAYLLLYNLLFIAPLFIIFLFALCGVTSEEFSRFLKKNLATIKILMAILFFGLGTFLLWRK